MTVDLRVERRGDLEYVCTGRGTPVALAHGAAGDVAMNFGPLLETLGPRHRLVGARYPGTGGAGPRTDLAAALRPEVLADRLVEAMTAEGHDAFPVVGVSFGCAVALTAALRHPDRVRALVLTVGFASADVQLRTTAATWAALQHAAPEVLGAYLLAQLSDPSSLAASERTGTFEREAAAFGAAVPAAGLAHLRAALDVDLVDRLADVEVPTLVVVAGADRLVLPQSGRALAAGIPGAELVEYEGAGHAFSAEHGRRWAHDIGTFLRRVGDVTQASVRSG